MTYSCKICFDDSNTPENPLLSPCNCKGSIKHTHKNCLETWITTSRRYTCSECRAPYKLLYKNNKHHFRNIFQTIKTFSLLYLPLHFLFYIIYTNTYEYSHLSPLNRLVFSVTTTYAHLGSSMISLLLIGISLLIIAGLIFSILELLSGNASSNFHPRIDSDDIRWFSDTLKANYYLKTAFTIDSQTSVYISFVLVTGLLLYCTYKLVRKEDVYIRIRT